MKSLPYYDDLTARQTIKLRELIKTLPPFAKEFFRAIDSTTQVRTRIAYAYDLRVFFHFLIDENPAYRNYSVLDFKVSDLDKIESVDLEEYMEAREQAQNASTVIRSPMTGTVIPLEEVPDEAFAGAMMGDGAAIVPTDGIVQAPADGEVTFVFPTKHAVGFRTDAGHEMLIHVGIDTVSLSGDGFEAFVSDGDHVRAGEPLLKVDIRKIGDRVPSMASPVLFTDLAENMEVRVLKKGQIHAGEPFMEVHRKADVGFC